MSNMKRSMRRVFWLLALCFFLLLGYSGEAGFCRQRGISARYNSRLRYVDETIKRGDILDREGEVIATSTRQEDGTYKREYPRDGWRHILQATAVSGKPALRQQKTLS